jgi:hypothetical protein
MQQEIRLVIGTITIQAILKINNLIPIVIDTLIHPIIIMLQIIIKIRI